MGSPRRFPSALAEPGVGLLQVYVEARPESIAGAVTASAHNENPKYVREAPAVAVHSSA